MTAGKLEGGPLGPLRYANDCSQALQFVCNFLASTNFERKRRDALEGSVPGDAHRGTLPCLQRE